MFSEVRAPGAAVRPGERHVHIVRVPPHVHRDDGDAHVNVAAAGAVLGGALDVVDPHEGIEAQQDRMAHVGVAVVHHFHVGGGVRGYQRAGRLPIPLQCGGGILAVPFG